MEEANKSIANSLKNGQYFIDAKTWYLFKYITPYVERNILIILTIFVMLSSSIAFIYYQQLSSRDPNISFLANNNDITNLYSSIKYLDNEGVSPQDRIEKYMTSQYVKKRESYSYKLIKEQINYVKKHSSAGMGQTYENLVSINSPNSPELLYQQNITRDIEIKSVTVDINDRHLYYVNFIATLNSNISKDVSSWQAKIKFTISDLETILDSGQKELDYQVTDYVAEQMAKPS